MCRWLAYTGSPVLLTDVLYTPVHSPINPSLHSRLGAETTNGDGFGIGWYDAEDPGGCSAASSRRGMTRTCASLRAT
jgi:glutamine amidotransferase